MSVRSLGDPGSQTNTVRWCEDAFGEVEYDDDNDAYVDKDDGDDDVGDGA